MCQFLSLRGRKNQSSEFYLSIVACKIVRAFFEKKGKKERIEHGRSEKIGREEIKIPLNVSRRSERSFSSIRSWQGSRSIDLWHRVARKSFYARCFVLAGTVTSLCVLILAISFLQLFQPVYAREHRVSIPDRAYTHTWGEKKVCNDLLRSLFNVFLFTISPYLHQRCLSNVRKHLLIAWTIRLKRVPMLSYPRCKIEKEKNIEKNARREAKSNPSISKSASSIGRNRSMIICGKLNNEQNGEFCLNSA